MTPAAAVLSDFRALGGRLWLQPDGKIAWRLPAALEPQAGPLVQRLRDCKPELLALLAGPPAACSSCLSGEFWRAEWGAWICALCHPDPCAGTPQARPVRMVRGWTPPQGSNQPGTICRKCMALRWLAQDGLIHCECGIAEARQ